MKHASVTKVPSWATQMRKLMRGAKEVFKMHSNKRMQSDRQTATRFVDR